MSTESREEQRRLTTIMFTDMVGYSALSQKNETLALEMLNEHRGILRAVFAKHAGREIEAVGDGFFAEFPSALAGARCAVEIQQNLHDRNTTAPPERSIQVRIGLHLGDVVVQDNHVHGDGVNIAARIEPLAEPGGIRFSEDVARQIQNKIELPLRKLGKGELKNIQMPVDIYRLVLPWERRHLPVSERVAFGLRRRQVRRALIGAGVLLVLALLVGTYGWQRARAPGAVAGSRVAVLPFASLSSDRGDEYFADGITEELISRLSRVVGLEVIARTSVMSYKGTTKKIAEIGRELSVGTVLEGSVRKEGNQLRITAQLIRVDNEAHLWSEDYDRDLKGVFAIQKDIADRVATAMAARLGTGKSLTSEPKGTQSVEAHNAYLKGRFHVNKASVDGVLKGIEYLEDAIRKDPSFALAYAAVADAYEQLPTQDDAYSKDVYPKARAAALRALELDESLAEAHTALGVVKTFHDRDWPGAGSSFRRALALNPNSAATHWWHGWYLLFLRQFDEGVGEIRTALELDPVSIAMNVDLVYALIFPGRWDEALDQSKKMLEMDRNNVSGLSAIGWVHLGKGMFREAETWFLKEVEAFGREPWVIVDLACAYALMGDTGRALAILDEIRASSKKKPVSGFTWALAYFGLARQDERYRAEMFKWLDTAHEERSYWLAQTSNQWWTPFHSDPRWVAFRKKLGLPP